MAPALLVLAGFAVVTALVGWSRWLAGRRWAGAGHGLLALGAALSVAVSWPATRQLADYEPEIAGEAAVAELSVEQLGSHRFRVTLTRLPSGRMQVFDLQGNEWQLDVRTLRWTGYAADLGLAPRQRVERLASRTAGTTGPVATQATTFRLAGTERDSDWPGPRSPWAWVISADERSSPWQPLAGPTRFRARLAATGVVVTPLNEAAADSVSAP
jgi:hypothetical protein